MNIQVPNPFPSDDLDWLAFCYINEELSESELQAFEARLLEDQLAREAVEQAVGRQLLLVAALGPNEAEPKPTVRLPIDRQTSPSNHQQHRPVVGRRFRFVHWATASAALLLLGWGLWMQWNSSSLQPGSELARLTTPENDELPNDDWIGNEDYADQLADALADASQDLGDSLSSEVVGEYTPVTLQNDWMLDVYSELGEAWEDLSSDEFDDATSMRSDLKGNWG